MPRPVSWLSQLVPIRRSVSNSVRSHYTRRDLELLFKLQPSSAGKLLELLPTVPIGGASLVERETLEAFLDRVAESDDVPGLLNQMRQGKGSSTRKKLRRLTRYDQEPIGMTSLPDWITIERGRLEVNFSTAEQLAEGMLMLAGILQHELEDFVAKYEPPSLLGEADIDAQKEMRTMFEELRQREIDG